MEASSVAQIFLVGKFSDVFPQVFTDIWISNMLKLVVYHTTIHRYTNWKAKCKTDRLIVEVLTTGR